MGKQTRKNRLPRRELSEASDLSLSMFRVVISLAGFVLLLFATRQHSTHIKLHVSLTTPMRAGVAECIASLSRVYLPVVTTQTGGLRVLMRNASRLPRRRPSRCSLSSISVLYIPESIYSHAALMRKETTDRVFRARSSTDVLLKLGVLCSESRRVR